MRYTDYRTDGPPHGKAPLAAYARLLASLAVAVLATTAVWVGWFHFGLRPPVPIEVPPAAFRAYLAEIWGVRMSGDLTRESVAFAVTRLTDPFVLGAAVVTEVVTLVLVLRRES